MSEIASGISSFAENGHSVDRKSTRLNSSHVEISYAVFCLKKKKKNKITIKKNLTNNKLNPLFVAIDHTSVHSTGPMHLLIISILPYHTVISITFIPDILSV